MPRADRSRRACALSWGQPRGEGDLNPRAQAHWISNPAPYQARRSPQGRIHWEPAINAFGATCISAVRNAARRTGLYQMRVSGPRGPRSRMGRGVPTTSSRMRPRTVWGRPTHDPAPCLESSPDHPAADRTPPRRRAESGRGRRRPLVVLPRIRSSLVRMAGRCSAVGIAAGRRAPREGIRLPSHLPPTQRGPGVLCRLLEWNALAVVPFVRDVCAVLVAGMGRLSRRQRTLCGRNRSSAEARRFALDSRLSPPAAASPHPRAGPGRPHRILPAHPIPAVRRLPSPPMAPGGPRGTPRCGPDWIPHVRLRPGVPRRRLARLGARQPDWCDRRGPPRRPGGRLPPGDRRREVRLGVRRPVRRALPREDAEGNGPLQAPVLDLPPRLYARDSAATRRVRAVP